MFNSFILITEQLILYCNCKENIDVDKLAGLVKFSYHSLYNSIYIFLCYLFVCVDKPAARLCYIIITSRYVK